MSHVRDVVGVTLLGLLGFEGVFVLAVYFGFKPNCDGTYFAGRVRHYDPIRGYRWVSQPTRTVRIMYGEPVFDATTFGNNEGFNARTEYAPLKPPGVYRLAVLGDSFTDASYLSRTWVDKANAIAGAGSNSASIQLYSFAVDGGGLANWESSAFGYILPKFELDAVVIANASNDLHRGFVVFDDEGRFSRFRMFASRPDGSHLSELGLDRCPLAPIVSNEDIDFLLALRRREVGLGWNGLRYLGLRWRERQSSLRDVSYCYSPLTVDQRDILLRRLVRGLQSAGKRVILATVPMREPLIEYLRGGPAPPGLAADADLAMRYSLAHFNGYAAFRERAAGTPREFVARHWLRHDPHWNQLGSDLFAAAFMEFLEQELRASRSSTTRSG